MAKIQLPPCEFDIKTGSVYSKVLLHRGRKYGPYAVAFTGNPSNKETCWEVSKIFNNFTN